MTRNESLASFIKGVHADLQAYKYLATLLEQQFSVGVMHDAARMQTTLDEIARTLTALDATRAARSELLRCIAAPEPARASIEQVLQYLPDKHRETLAVLWQELSKLVERCRELNARNGRLFASQNEIFQRVLDIEPQTYAPA